MGEPLALAKRQASPRRRSAVIRVFVSSTWLDLQPERRAVKEALDRLRDTKFVGMEYFGSRYDTPLSASLAEVEDSDVYVGIVGSRYGSGITEKEYLRARELGLPCFIYQKPAEPSEEDLCPDPRLEAFLAEVKRHTITKFSCPTDLKAQVAIDLQSWLFDKFLFSRLAEVLQGERPSRDAEEILAGVRDLPSLDHDLLTRLGQAGFVADSYIDPRPVFDRLDLDRFTGRLWLISEVEAFLAENDRGYFILEADAGLGKTAFLAHLVQERGWVHHFVEQAPGLDGVGPGLRNLASQIALAWRLEPYTSQWSLPAASARPDFLQGLLFEAAKRRNEVAPGEKIVLVVDALDESAAPQGQNVLGLPRVLPQGVYLVISQRPVEVVLATEGPRRAFLLDSAEPRNEEDMRAFLGRVAYSENVSALLAESGIPSEDFVTTLLNRSQGVWIYLHYVLAEIKHGKRRPLELETLPQGLWGYYFQYWLQRRTNPVWDSLELPLLATLAAIQEELPARLLCAFAGISETPQVNRLLDDTWRPFLAVAGAGERRYRCYHASFREFLDGRADPPTVAERTRAAELAAATRAAHGRIADRAFTAWRNLADGLPGLRDPDLRALDGGYALRHLATHLRRAGRLGDLAALLRLEWTREERRENVWYTVHEEERDLAGWLGDVTLLWRAAEAASEEAVSRGEPAVSIVLEISAALLISSVRNLASQVKPALLAALVEKGIWRTEHALAYAHQVPDLQDRFLSMVLMTPLLPEPTRDVAITKALVAARGLRTKSRQRAFQAFPPGLPREFLEELLKRELASPWDQSKTLPLLAAKLPEDLLREALASVCAAKPIKTELLIALLPLAPPDEREKLLPLALAAIGEMWWEDSRIVALLRLADFLPAPEAERIARRGLEIARGPSRSDPPRALLLALAIPVLKGQEQENVAREALAAAVGPASKAEEGILERMQRDSEVKANFLELIPRLPLPLLRLAEEQALKGSRGWYVDSCLIPFAPRWAGQTGKVEKALFQLEKKDTSGREAGLTALAPVLPDELVERAFRLALKIQEIEERAIALEALAFRLSRPQLEEALASVLGSGSGTGTGWILSNLLIQLAVLGRAEESLDKIEQFDWVRARPLVEVARHLLRPDDLHRAVKKALRLSSDEARCEALAGIAALALVPAGERSRLLAEAERSARWASRLSIHGGPRPDLRLGIALARTGPNKQKALRKVLAEIPPWAKKFFDPPVAELLDTLVPHLKAPLLQEALALAGPLHELGTIYGIDKMPKILRAILPRLPEVLIAEILLLAPDELSPTLTHPGPEPTTAFSMEKRAIRFRLGDLLPQLVERLWSLVPRQVRCSEFALNIAKELAGFLPGKTLQAQALVALALASGSTKKSPLFFQAAEAALLIPSPTLRAAALTDLLSLHPSSELVYLSLATALVIAKLAARADALDALAPHLHPYLAVRLRRTAGSIRRAGPLGEPTEAEALEILCEAASTSGILQCLDRLSPENREPLLRQTLEAAKGLDEQTTLRAWALLQLVPYLPTAEGEALVQNEIGEISSAEAVAYLVAEWGTRISSPLPEPIARALLESRGHRTEVLSIAAPHLPDTVLATEMEKIWSLDDLKDRTRALSALALRLASLPVPPLLALWQKVLRRAAEGKREEVIATLEALLPVIKSLGGEEALGGIWDVLTSPGSNLP